MYIKSSEILAQKTVWRYYVSKSEYSQELPQLQTADQGTLRKSHGTLTVNNIRKTFKAKQTALTTLSRGLQNKKRHKVVHSTTANLSLNGC